MSGLFQCNGYLGSFKVHMYYLELKEDAKNRYVEKLKDANCLKDPYYYLESKKNISNALEWTEWPDVSFADIYNYLVLTVSSYTCDQVKAYKSLDGYNFFINGWVNDVTVLNTGKPRDFLFLSRQAFSKFVINSIKSLACYYSAW